MEKKEVPEKIIFVDIDGVLNDIRYLSLMGSSKDLLDIDPKRLTILGQICAATNAQVVLTSSWRHNPLLPELFAESNIPLYGILPEYSDSDIMARSTAIAGYIKAKNIEKYIILDDEPYYTEEQMGHSIITLENSNQHQRLEHDYFEGLQPKHVKWAIAMLEG